MPNPTAPQLVAGLTPEQEAYYNDRKLLWRNSAMILLLTLGWAACLTVVYPLLQLKLKKSGFSEENLGWIGAINSWVYCVLVIYFAWKSDHTVTRFGRRIPFLFISAPVIITSIALFPFFENKWILLALFMAQTLFMDIKAATIPLLGMDCMPRHMLARFGALSGIVTSIISFFALRAGTQLADRIEWAPYVGGALVMTVTTLVGGLGLKEPPVHNPATEPFRPWSTFQVALADKRALLLMLGVGLIWTFSIPIYGGWIWILAKEKLHLTRSDIGAAVSWSILLPLVLSYPIGWITDRYGCTKLMVAFWVMTCVSAWWCMTHLHNASGLAISALLVAVTGSLYGAVDIMVYRHTHPNNMGAVTSTNSSLRQLLAGGSAVISGSIITRSGGNYNRAFLYGLLASTLGFALILTYLFLMRQRSPDLSAGADEAANEATGNPAQPIAVEVTP